MCLLCKYKKTEIPTVNLESVGQVNVDRSNGLSNVYNINNDLSFNDEVFSGPLYTITGATLPNSGFTTTNCSGVTTASTYSTSGCTAVYNLSEVDEVDLTFEITGNTEYTGYTGSFCYHTFRLRDLPKDREYITKKDSVYSKCFDYSAITANTIYESINAISLSRSDNEYIIKDYNIFNTKNFLDNLKVNSFDLTTYPKEDLFNDGWYFVTTIDPEPPSIGPSQGTFDITQGVVLTTEIPLLQEGQTSIFKIAGFPLNNLFIVHVNGVQLTEGLDWVVLSLKDKLFEITSGTLEPLKDVVQVTYLNNPGNVVPIVNDNELGLQLDSTVVSSITSVVTSGVTTGTTSLTVNYNSYRSRQEVLLTKSVRVKSNLYFVVNGVRLAEEVDYFKSSSDPKKLIMSPSSVLKIGDAISVFYYTNESLNKIDLGYFRTLTPTITWSTPESYTQYKSEDGKFLLQVTTDNDANFLNPIQSKFYDFSTLRNAYEAVLDQLPTNLGQNFLVRVYFFKDYHILFDNVITTRSVSDTASFKVNLNYGENSY